MIASRHWTVDLRLYLLSETSMTYCPASKQKWEGTFQVEGKSRLVQKGDPCGMGGRVGWGEMLQIVLVA